MPKISRAIHFAGNPFPGEFRAFRGQSISREISGISREISLEMTAGEFPGKYGPAQPDLVGYAHSGGFISLLVPGLQKPLALLHDLLARKAIC